MSRRIWTIAAAAWAGTLAAQTPAAPGGPSIVTLRTAGQPERRVQVLKTERLPDGKILTEVKDLTSGAIFTIADTKPLTGEAAPSLPIVAPALPGATLPGTTVPSNLPQARPRNFDPLLGNTAPMPSSRTSTPTQTEFPTLVGKLRNNATPAPSLPPGAKPQSAISTALFGSYSEPTPQPLVGKFNEAPGTVKSPAPSNTTGLKAAVFGSPASPPVETPTLMGKLFGDSPATAPAKSVIRPAPTQVVKHQANVIRPNAVPAVPAATARMTIATPPAPALEPARPAITQVHQVEPAASLAPVSMDSRDPNFHVVPPKPMTMKQIEEMVKDLRMHHKPSQRVEAANALASCPMAGMVEVRQILAEASFRDPIPVVRAHCIELLTKMNYDEPNYRTYVEGLVNDEEPAVQRAARAAVK